MHQLVSQLVRVFYFYFYLFIFIFFNTFIHNLPISPEMENSKVVSTGMCQINFYIKKSNKNTYTLRNSPIIDNSKVFLDITLKVNEFSGLQHFLILKLANMTNIIFLRLLKRVDSDVLQCESHDNQPYLLCNHLQIYQT